MAHQPWRKVLATSLVGAVLAGCGISAQLGAPGSDLPAIERAFSHGKTTAVVAIDYRHREQLRQLVEAGMDLWGVDAKANRAFGTVGPAQLDVLHKLGLLVKTEPSLHVFNNFDKGYHTYDTTLADLKALAARYPQRCDLVDLGPTYETLKGKAQREIWGLHVHNGDASGKPGVVFVANHHAREIVTPEMALNIAHMMLDGYGTDAEMTAAVDGRDTWIVPMVNPDGHARAAKGDDWRKNTDPETSLLDWGAYGAGVDLNRNYTYHWGEGGASAEPDDPTFRGRSAGSEPEVQAIMKLVSSRKFAYLMTYHSFSNLVLWPWGYTDDPPPDNRLAAVGKKLASYNGYTPEQSKDLYRTSGDTTDWAFGSFGTLAYTTEIGTWGDGFDPAFKKVAQFWKENEPGARYLLKTADNPGAVFGAEVKVSGSEISAPSGAQVEAFVDRRGPDGTGLKVAAVPASRDGRKHLVFVHARVPGGAWGPTEVAWSR